MIGSHLQTAEGTVHGSMKTTPCGEVEYAAQRAGKGFPEEATCETSFQKCSPCAVFLQCPGFGPRRVFLL